jgi:branched-chain amino acid transport system permease protein
MKQGVVLSHYKLLIYGLLFAIVAALPFIIKGNFITHVLILCYIQLITVMSFNLLFGYTGLISLGHSAFYAIGGYTSALVVINLNVPWPVGMLCAAIVAGIFAILLGLPIIRLHQAYLMFATFAAAEVVRIIISTWESVTHGVYGILHVPPMFESLSVTYVFVFVMMMLSFLFIYRLVHSRIGRAFVTIRDNESIAASIGINVTRYKLLSFVISGIMCGVAGAMTVHHLGNCYPELVGSTSSINMALYTIIGGPGFLLGPPITGFIFTLLPHILFFIRDYYALFLAILIILAVLFMPNGLEPILRRRYVELKARIKSRGESSR